MAKCKDCLHVDVCQNHCDEQYCEGCSSCMFRSCNFSDRAEKCPNFKDHSRFVELPCNAGTTVYETDGIRIYPHQIKKLIFDAGHIAFDEGAIGSSVFLTREEAEAELARRTTNG